MAKYDGQLLTENISNEVLSYVPEKMISSRSLFPIRIEKGLLTVVSSNYQDNCRDSATILDVIRQDHKDISKLKILEIDYGQIKAVYEKYFNKALQQNQQDADAIIDSGPTTQQTELAQKILKDAIWHNATDIHITPTSHGTMIYFEINGNKELQNYPMTITDEQMLSNIYKQMCNIERRDLIAQDGHFTFQSKNVRFNSVPYGISGGRNIIAMRINSGNSAVPKLTERNFLPEDIDKLKRIIKKPSGIFLICGPTGEGKTSTQASLLTYLMGLKNIHVVSIEDPIEIIIDGVGQSQIRDAKDEDTAWTWEKALKSFLRQNPDVIQVGEIRDSATGLLAVQASQTGHLILSTLHVRNSISVFRRLNDIGANIGSFTEQIIGICSQRLVPQLCPHCKKEVVSARNKELRKKDLALLKDGKSWEKGDGCPNCNHGIINRIPILEIIEFNNYLRDFFSEPHGLIEIEKYLRQNTDFKSLWDKGMALVAKGEISLSMLLDKIEIDEDLENEVKP